MSSGVRVQLTCTHFQIACAHASANAWYSWEFGNKWAGSYACSTKCKAAQQSSWHSSGFEWGPWRWFSPSLTHVGSTKRQLPANHSLFTFIWRLGRFWESLWLCKNNQKIPRDTRVTSVPQMDKSQQIIPCSCLLAVPLDGSYFFWPHCISNVKKIIERALSK